ncbi:hypothetical protein LEMLEM_LOCUS7876 [Lemmus lemmus]
MEQKGGVEEVPLSHSSPSATGDFTQADHNIPKYCKWNPRPVSGKHPTTQLCFNSQLAHYVTSHSFCLCLCLSPRI